MTNEARMTNDAAAAFGSSCRLPRLIFRLPHISHRVHPQIGTDVAARTHPRRFRAPRAAQRGDVMLFSSSPLRRDRDRSFGGRFGDRHDAGRRLGEALAAAGYDRDGDVIILALPRGGVPVAYEVARRLDAPLDVFLVRKLGVPGHEELAMGAIASGGVLVLNDDVLRHAHVGQAEVEHAARREAAELARRERAYRGDRPPPAVHGKTVILIDDGLATGASMRAAAEAVSRLNPKKVVVAVPVAAPETCEQFRALVDDVVCAVTPQPFAAVGMWYEDFSQTSDDEVRELLERAAREHPAHA
jgi:predicted phosphoribosyltransferase